MDFMHVWIENSEQKRRGLSGVICAWHCMSVTCADKWTVVTGWYEKYPEDSSRSFLYFHSLINSLVEKYKREWKSFPYSFPREWNEDEREFFFPSLHNKDESASGTSKIPNMLDNRKTAKWIQIK